MVRFEQNSRPMTSQQKPHYILKRKEKKKQNRKIDLEESRIFQHNINLNISSIGFAPLLLSP